MFYAPIDTEKISKNDGFNIEHDYIDYVWFLPNIDQKSVHLFRIIRPTFFFSLS